ncbi:MAG: YraN family protein [Gammaproteobacteria bacterium]|nr:YraN family protein [Gammaproteobacteria bacterium]
MKGSDPVQTGTWAEGVALEHLQHRGLFLISRNYRCKLGELDLVMEHGSTIVFVEVRLRNNLRFGSGAESVNHAKQRKLIRAAGVFLMYHPKLNGKRCRFDVVSVSKRNYRVHCEWIQDAFS